MVVHIDMHYQITLTMVTSAGQPDLFSVPARRYSDFDLTRFRDSPTPLTLWARMSV